MASNSLIIRHTRLKREVTIIGTHNDDFDPMTIIIEFEHTLPNEYFQGEDDIIYGLYLDKEFVGEIRDKFAKVQLEQFDVSHILEIFAHPHSGFEYEMERTSPGNKIRIRFRARDPNVKDIYKHVVYWDNQSGNPTLIMGEVDALTGSVNGSMLKSGSVSQG